MMYKGCPVVTFASLLLFVNMMQDNPVGQREHLTVLEIYMNE